jgi:hypothetical protein
LIHINNDFPQLAPYCKNVRKNRCPVTNMVQMLNVIFKEPLVSRVALLGCRLRPIYYGLVVIYVRKCSCWIPFTTPRTWTKIWMVHHCWRWLQRPLSQNLAVLYICWYGLGSRKTIVFEKPRNGRPRQHRFLLWIIEHIWTFTQISKCKWTAH